MHKLTAVRINGTKYCAALFSSFYGSSLLAAGFKPRGGALPAAASPNWFLIIVSIVVLGFGFVLAKGALECAESGDRDNLPGYGIMAVIAIFCGGFVLYKSTVGGW